MIRSKRKNKMKTFFSLYLARNRVDVYIVHVAGEVNGITKQVKLAPSFSEKK